eukprot:96905-Prymnesium_polylepis.1
MVAESGKLGPRNIAWLKNKLDPQHVGTNFKTVLDIFGMPFSGDIHSQVRLIESIVTKSRALEGDFQLNSAL